MSAVGKVLKGVGGAVGGATDFLVGGKPQVISSENFSPMSDQEKQRLEQIDKSITELYSQQPDFQGDANQLSKTFKDLVSQFVAKDYGTAPSPEQMKEAQSFVDSTFYAPAQEQLRQYEADFGATQAAQAAALGRNPNADLATQQAIFKEGLRARTGMELERGSRVAQEARGINELGYTRDLNRLGTASQGANFLNNLAQQAFSNRLNLLNGRSGLAQFYQQERSRTPLGINHSSGLLTNINAIQNSAMDVYAMGSQNRKFMQDSAIAAAGSAGKAGAAGGGA